jgi:large subunit ribosomal protein L25
MNQSFELLLEDRTALGSKAVRKLRQAGNVPAVVYGHDFEAKAAMVDYPTAVRVYKEAGKHHPVELQIGGTKKLAMIKDVEIDPLKHRLQHMAFHVVKQNEVVETNVPIVIDGKGSTPAERAGLVLIQTVEEVAVKALPRQLPDELHADGEKLVDEGDQITFADLKIPKDVEIDEEDLTKVVIRVYTTAALEAANDAAAGEAEAGDEEEVPAEEGAEGAAVNEGAEASQAQKEEKG